MRGLQRNVEVVGRVVFGDANIDDQRERILRFGEEAMELMRSAGLKMSDVMALAYEEFLEKPVAGELSQEIAGVQNTLFALATSHKVDVYEVCITEIERMLNNKDKCRTKHDAKKPHLVAQRVIAA
jgi:hypothetical protein